MTIANKLRTASGEEDPKIYELFSHDGYKGEDITPKLLLHEDLNIAENPTTIWTKKNQDVGSTNFVVTSPDIMGYSQYLDLGDDAGSQTYSIINDIPSTGGIRFNGGSTGGQSGDWANFNHTDYTYSSYAFREHPKFFSEMSYIGTNANKTFSHGLKDDLGMAIFRNRIGGNWIVWHKDMDTFESSSTPYHKVSYLNSMYPPESAYIGSVRHWGGNAVSGTTNNNSAGTFTIGNGSQSSSTSENFARINVSGESHIAWFFPDNEYVKCGKFETAGLTLGSSWGHQVDLGFEPQFVLMKNQYMSSDWRIFDRFGGIVNGNSSQDHHLIVNRFDDYTNQYRSTPYYEDTQIFFNARGFSIKAGTNDFSSNAAASILYMAIPRDNEPRLTDNLQKRIFGYCPNLSSYTGGVPAPHQYINNFKADFGFFTKSTDGWHKKMVGTKIGNRDISLNQSITSYVLGSHGSTDNLWKKSGYGHDYGTTYTPYQYLWKCTKGVCDHQIYINNEGSTASVYTVKHNLGAVPELMIFRKLVSGTNDPPLLYHKDISSDGTYLDKLDGSTGSISNYNSGQTLNNYTPTATQFKVIDGATSGYLGQNEYHYVWLFASYPGVSKVGSFSSSGSGMQYHGNGFPESCKVWVLYRKIKDTSNNFVSDPWRMFSTDRGIGVGWDLSCEMTTANNEDSSTDHIEVANVDGETKVGWNNSTIAGGSGTYAYMIFAYTD